MEDDALRLWALGGGTWQIEPDGGEVTEAEEAVPLLWAPDGRRRISVSNGATSTITLLNRSDEEVASTSIQGLVSHVRWSPNGDRVVFTVARLAANGGILQDLFLWDLGDGEAPTQLTSTGAAFGSEWLGTAARWQAPEEG
jgi:WD40 repeat protein